MAEKTYTGVIVFKKNHVYISSVYDELVVQDIYDALILRRLDDKWGRRNVEYPVRGMHPIDADPHTLLNMCINGKIVELTFPGDREEDVDTSEDGPSDLVHLRSMKQIGKHVYVAGMARRVYRREKPGVWKPVDDGTFVPRDKRTIPIGFNGIDGFSEQDIYAVGYNGEIWCFDGVTWIQDDSPTNVVLNCVCCTPNSDVYIAGMAGVLLRGKKGQWAVVEQTETEEDFWGMTTFQERVYLSNYDGVFYVDGDDIVKVDFGIKKELTTAYIHAADGIMYSVGQKDIAYTTDGVSWIEVDKP